MAKKRKSSFFADALNGFSTGWDLADKYQNSQLEKQAGEAYKNGGQTTATESSYGKAGEVKPDDAYTGANANGEAMTNAEAASYGLMQPTETKTSFSLEGKTQDKAFSEGQQYAAKSRAAAGIYEGAGKFKDANGLIRDAASMRQSEMSMAKMEDETARETAMNASIDGAAGVGDVMDTATGKKVTAADVEARLVAQGVDPETAKGMSQSTLDTYKLAQVGENNPLGVKTAKLSDQYTHSAAALKLGGAKYAQAAIEASSKGAAEKAKEMGRDLASAKTVQELNDGPYSRINHGQNIEERPLLDAKGKPTGAFQYVNVGSDKKIIGTPDNNSGQGYKNFDEYKARLITQISNDPDKFVSWVQEDAKKRLENLKFEETKRHNKSSESTAAYNAQTNRTESDEKVTDIQLTRAGHEAYALREKDPEAKLTPIQARGLSIHHGKQAASNSTPEKQNVALDKLSSHVKDYLKAGDAPGQISMDENDGKRRQFIQLEANRIGVELLKKNRVIDPAAVIKMAEENYKNKDKKKLEEAETMTVNGVTF